MTQLPKYARLSRGEHADPAQAVVDIIVIEDNLDGGDGGSGTVTADDITDATATGRNVLTAENPAAARDAIGAGTSSLALGTSGSTAAAGNHTHTADDITDATATGRNVLTAENPAAARDAIGAGTSDLALGSTSGTAAAGNHTHTAAQITASTVGDGSATTVQGILAELDARIADIETT